MRHAAELLCRGGDPRIPGGDERARRVAHPRGSDRNGTQALAGADTRTRSHDQRGSAALEIAERYSDRVTRSLPSRVGSAGAFLSWTFDVSLPARVESAKAEVLAAEATVAQTKREARGEAARAHIGLRTAERQLQYARASEEAADDVSKVVDERYRRGLSGPLDVIQAEDAALEMHAARIEAERSRDRAIVRLRVSTGRPIAGE